MTQGRMASDCPCMNCPARGEVEVLLQKLSVLQDANKRLQVELEEMRMRYWLKGKKKKEEGDKENGAEQGPAKRGAPLGHPGWFRKKPKHIDHTVEVTLSKCPHCHSKDLSLCSEIEEHIQEDIEIPRVYATLYRKRTYLCRGCGATVSGVGENELPRSFIGPVAKTLGVWLKYDVKISDRDLKRVFETLFNLKIVPASLCGFRDQLTRQTKNLYEQLKKRLQRSSHAYVDETGWKVDGVLNQLWSASTSALSLLMIHPSRGVGALKEILGEEFAGILISDFLAVYNRMKARAKQRCNVHLLRELKHILKSSGCDAAIQRYAETLKGVIQRALALKRNFDQGIISAQTLADHGEQIRESLKGFENPDPTKEPIVRIAKRITKYKEELLTFLFHPTIDGHNNQAERMIRPNVLLRKITFGNRSDKGAINHSVLMSMIQTAKKNDRSPPQVLQKILQVPPKKRTLELLGVPKEEVLAQ